MRKAVRGQRGFSLAEILVVIAIVALLVAIVVPLVGSTLRAAAVRGAADQFAIDLRAARMIAVTRQNNVDFTITVDPTNRYAYTRQDGTIRTIDMPRGVKIVSSSPTTITFQANGSVVAAATTVLEVAVDSGTERWTVSTNTLGMPTIVRARVAS